MKHFRRLNPDRFFAWFSGFHQLGCCLILLTLISLGVASGADDVAPQGPLDVVSGTPAALAVRLKPRPADKPVAVLSFQAWIEAREVTGATPVLQVSVDGERLTESLGREKTVVFAADGRETPAYVPEYGWLLYYGPNPEALRGPGAYWVSDTFDPASFRLILPEFEPGDLSVEFLSSRAAASGEEAITVRVEDVRIEYLSQQEADAYFNK